MTPTAAEPEFERALHSASSPEIGDEGEQVAQTGEYEDLNGLEGLEGSSTDALLADLASSRGRRLEVEPPLDEDEEPAAPLTSPRGQAQIVSMSDHRKVAMGQAGRHPANARRRVSAPSAASPAPPTPTTPTSPQAAASVHSAPTMPTAQVEERTKQEGPPERPATPTPRSKRRSRRSVPSWDEIVFGAKPE